MSGMVNEYRAAPYYGDGNMLVKAASLVTIANRSGAEINQGSMIRYVAEIIRFPYAALGNYLDCHEIDNTHAV